MKAGKATPCIAIEGREESSFLSSSNTPVPRATVTVSQFKLKLARPVTADGPLQYEIHLKN